MEQLRAAHENVSELGRQIHDWHRSNELSLRLETIPGIAPISTYTVDASRASVLIYSLMCPAAHVASSR